jgi:hypothetical protein
MSNVDAPLESHSPIFSLSNTANCDGENRMNYEALVYMSSLAAAVRFVLRKPET